MRQIWIPRIGKPEVLEIRESAAPEPKEGELTVDVAAAGINFADILARMGLYPDAPQLPAVVGYEVSGTVAKTGPGVENFKPGDRVIAMTRFGGYSEVVCVPVHQVFHMPQHLSFEKAAAVPVNYLTAWTMLVYLGNVRPGDRVLVHAIGGGVGLAALQICKWKGAEVIGTASTSKHEKLREMGVSHCIDYRTQDFQQEVKSYTGGKGVDLVLDAVGGDSFLKSYKCLAPLGRLFVFGVSSIAPGKKRSFVSMFKTVFQLPKFKIFSLINRNRGVMGVNIGHLWEEREKIGQMSEDILKQVEAKRFDPIVDRSFPFHEAAHAHDYIQSRKNFGKVLLVP